jgi:hypothetical protein
MFTGSWGRQEGALMARKGSEGPARLGVHWTLPADLRRRFGAYASFRGEDESALVTDALRSLMAGFHVGDGRAPKGPGKAAPAAGDEPPAAVPPDRRESA